MRRIVRALVVRAEVETLDDQGRLVSRHFSNELPIFEADFQRVNGLMQLLKERGLENLCVDPERKVQ